MHPDQDRAALQRCNGDLRIATTAFSLEKTLGETVQAVRVIDHAIAAGDQIIVTGGPARDLEKLVTAIAPLAVAVDGESIPDMNVYRC